MPQAQNGNDAMTFAFTDTNVFIHYEFLRTSTGRPSLARAQSRSFCRRLSSRNSTSGSGPERGARRNAQKRFFAL
jgi:hypothetical protein